MQHWSNALKAIAAIIAASCGLAPAHAETIPVEGVYAARVTLPPDAQRILIDRFGGDLGPDVELALSDTLGRAIIRGEPYFDLITPNALRGGLVEVEGNDGTTTHRPLVPDAELRGSVRSEVFERRAEPRKERVCVERNDDGDCTEREEVDVACWELVVRVDPRIVMNSASGERLYSHDASRTKAQQFCASDDEGPSSLEMANEIVDEIAQDVRLDLAPTQTRQDIRVMERRRDLRREDRDAFREAVRATKESIEAACAGFDALEVTNPDHVSVLFNIGLCLESGGELDQAADYYSRALAIDPGRDYPTAGLRRVRSGILAEEQLAQREGL